VPKSKYDPNNPQDLGETQDSGETQAQGAEQERDQDAEQIRQDRARLRTRILNAFAALRELRASGSAPGDTDRDAPGLEGPREGSSGSQEE
jgi:hypothetical protein